MSFEGKKAATLEKWKQIREQLKLALNLVNEQCGFCDLYYVGNIDDAPDDCECPAMRVCKTALYDVRPNLKEVRDKVTRLIGRISRVRKPKNEA